MNNIDNNQKLKRNKFGFKQGQYHPVNKSKYIGTPPVYRSSWEYKAFRWLDMNSNILSWGSESFVVKYKDPTRNDTWHRYFVDLMFTARTKDGTIKKFAVEIKPYKETVKPQQGRKSPKTFLNESLTYCRNVAKWKAAVKASLSRGITFCIWTEKQLLIEGL